MAIRNVAASLRFVLPVHATVTTMGRWMPHTGFFGTLLVARATGPSAGCSTNPRVPLWSAWLTVAPHHDCCHASRKGGRGKGKGRHTSVFKGDTWTDTAHITSHRDTANCSSPFHTVTSPAKKSITMKDGEGQYKWQWIAPLISGVCDPFCPNNLRHNAHTMKWSIVMGLTREWHCDVALKPTDPYHNSQWRTEFRTSQMSQGPRIRRV